LGVPLPLLLAAALVGILHMSAPDHWATLAMIGHRAGWTRGRLLTISLTAGVGHLILSFAVGFAVVFLGLYFSTIVSYYFTLIVGGAMVIGGLLVALRSSRQASEEESKGDKSFGYFAVLGAALSPDLAILPVFLYATAVSLEAVLDTAVIFALATIATLITLVLGSSLGFAKALQRLPPKYNDAVAGLVIAVVGVYVLLFG